MSFVVFLRPVREEMPLGPTEEEARIVGEHLAYLQKLCDEGKVVVAGPSVVPGDTIGITIMDVEDEAEARTLMNDDPAIVNGIMTGELRPLRIAVR